MASGAPEGTVGRPFRDHRETLWAFLIAQERRKRTREYQSVKLPERLYRQYFAHKSKAEAAEIMEKALEFYHRNIEELL